MSESIASLAPIMQLAYVPKDVDEAIGFWTKTMGAGPFFRLGPVEYEAASYRGEPSEISFTVLIGYWGEMQIELIEQHCDSPSIYKAWLDQGAEGLHHVCIVVDDIAKARGVCERAGATIEQEIVLTGGGEAFYADTGGGPGTMVEVLEPAPAFAAFCEMAKEAHRTWDGDDPVRTLG